MIQGRANAAVAAERRRKRLKKHTSLQEIEVESDSSSESESSSEEAPVRCKRINEITKSNRFSLVVASMIMLNVVVMGLQANFEDLYLPWQCSRDSMDYHEALVARITELKQEHKLGADMGRRLGLQARHHRHRHRRDRAAEAQRPRRRRLEEEAADAEAAASTVLVHTLAVDGFPDENSSRRSFLNGYYRERVAPQYQLGNRSTFWDLSGQRYIFYCPHLQSWGIGSIIDWEANIEGKCVWGACTFPGAKILDLASARFTRLFDGYQWIDIDSAGVIDVQTEETVLPSGTTAAPSGPTVASTEPPSTSTSTTTSTSTSTTSTGAFDSLVGQVQPQMLYSNFSVRTQVAQYAADKGCVDVWIIINSCFLIFFVCELAFRLITYGLDFFTSEDQWWNLFDFSIVMLGCFDAASRLIYTGQTSSKLVMMVRVVRILRILRVLRLFKEFRKLTMLIRGLVESFTIVFWICLLMLMFMVVYAIFCTTLVGHQAEEYEEPEVVRMYFGSVYNSTVTLFQFLTLDDWSTITRMVWNRQPIMLPMFLIYIVVVSLVVVSLLTGVMAEHMNTVRESEEALEEQERQTKLRIATRVLYDAFKRVDVDNSKSVNFEEFEMLIKDPELLAELKEIDLDLGDFEPYELFCCFDQDFDGKLTWDEFRDGMEELRKPVGAKVIFKLQATMQRVVAHQVQAETVKPTGSTPPSSPASASPLGRPRMMSAEVEGTMEKVNEAMSGIEETLDSFEGDLKEFVGELRKRKHRGTL